MVVEMHFRIRRHVVQLVRMTCDLAIKRSKAEVVGSVKLLDPALPDVLRQKLTNSEVAELESWLSTNSSYNFT